MAQRERQDGNAEREPGARVIALDALRGLCVVSMVAFHTCYDLAYLYGVPMPWFTGGPLQDVWRCSISWTFLFLAGWMTSFSRSNLKRAGVYAAAALLVFAATSLASVDTAISFGILYCMAASTALYVLVSPLLERAPAPVALCMLLALFCLTYRLPHARYAVEGLAWLGFPSAGFSSGDYYPLLPYCLLYLSGAVAARWHAERLQGRYPAWMHRDLCPALSWIGRHSLIIYLAHQPVVLAVLGLVFGT